MEKLTVKRTAEISMEFYSENEIHNKKLEEILTEINKEAESGNFYFYINLEHNLGEGLINSIVCRLRLLGFKVNKQIKNEKSDTYSINWLIWNDKD